MSGSPAHRLGGLLRRRAHYPSERDWERSPLLTPRPAGYEPALVSDGGGPAFAPDALRAPDGVLDESDPAVQALVAMLARQKTPAGEPAARDLTGWRRLAGSDDEVLFGYGLPPKLLTVLMRRENRRRDWMSHAVSREVTLRAERDGVRASGWRLDPGRAPDPGDTELRILVTEQTRSSGRRARDRLLAPDLHAGPDALVLRTYVRPLTGYQTTPADPPETAARIVLPEPVGTRDIIDGALLHAIASPTAAAPDC